MGPTACFLRNLSASDGIHYLLSGTHRIPQWDLLPAFYGTHYMVSIKSSPYFYETPVPPPVSSMPCHLLSMESIVWFLPFPTALVLWDIPFVALGEDSVDMLNLWAPLPSFYYSPPLPMFYGVCCLPSTRLAARFLWDSVCFLWDTHPT